MDCNKKIRHFFDAQNGRRDVNNVKCILVDSHSLNTSYYMENVIFGEMACFVLLRNILRVHYFPVMDQLSNTRNFTTKRKRTS